MNLTGKALNKFHEWFLKNSELFEKIEDTIKIYAQPIEFFNTCPDSMKWGVLVGFFESEGIYIGLEVDDYCMYSFLIKLKKTGVNKLYEHYELFDIESREESREEAIKEANELLNQRLNEG